MDKDVMTGRLNRLLENDKRSELRGALLMLNAVDVAGYLSELETDKMLKVFRILPGDIASEVFSYMDDDQRQKLVESISDKELCSLVDDMFIDDAVDFLEELPPELVKRVLANVPEETRKTINRFLSYPENSAGSIMTIEFCAFRADISVMDAMAEIRKNGVDKETINTLYVLDEGGKLVGSLPLRKLLVADETISISSLMEPGIISVSTLDDQEQVAETMRKYDLMAVPVADKEGRPVGIITADDIMDVIQDEATEDMEKMSGLTPSEDEYMKTSPFNLAKNRLPWLIIMMISGILTETIIDHFSATLTVVAFSACIPMLMGTGGNCGSQASTLAIRALALGEIGPADALKVLWKEFRVSIVVSMVLSVFSFLIQFFLFARTLGESITISAAMIGTVVLSKTIGCLLPLLAKKLKLDPALMAAPLITTVVDVCSLLILVLFAGLSGAV